LRRRDKRAPQAAPAPPTKRHRRGRQDLYGSRRAPLRRAPDLITLRKKPQRLNFFLIRRSTPLLVSSQELRRGRFLLIR
jgi:hypothetical protein